MEGGRNNEPNCCKSKENRLSTRGRDIESLRFVTEAASKRGEAEDQKYIADDGSGERCFDHIVEPFSEGSDGDDQLGCISEGGIQETADPLSGMMGDLFCCMPEQAGKRHDGETGREKDVGVGFRFEELQPNRNRNENQ